MPTWRTARKDETTIYSLKSKSILSYASMNTSTPFRNTKMKNTRAYRYCIPYSSSTKNIDLQDQSMRLIFFFRPLQFHMVCACVRARKIYYDEREKQRWSMRIEKAYSVTDYNNNVFVCIIYVRKYIIDTFKQQIMCTRVRNTCAYETPRN